MVSTLGGPSPVLKTQARILLVDDDPLIAELVVDMLGMDGHEVDTAANGIEALEKLQGQRYDLIVTDLHMPKMDGSGFYRELLQRQAHPSMKIIFLTGTTGGSEEQRFIAENGLPLLLKPFNMAQLMDLVHRVLNAP
jgi:two-component system chemotaxis response regulator CheY